MGRGLLREIEEKYGRMLESWDRTKGMDCLLVLPYVFPPEDFVIQGIRRPDPPGNARRKPAKEPVERPLKMLDAAKLGECFRCDFLDKLSAKCLLKRVRGEGACIRDERTRRELLRPRWEGELCRFCDFSDKRSGYCLIKRVNGADCPFARKRNGKTEAAP